MTRHWYFYGPLVDLLSRYQFLEIFSVRTLLEFKPQNLAELQVKTFFLQIQPQELGKLGVVRSENLIFKVSIKNC